MHKPVLVFFICYVVFNVVETSDPEDKLEECGPNEVLNDCVGCPSEDSCYDRGQIVCPRWIGHDCSPACVCKEGFIRKTIDRECIPKEECGAPCDRFEEYTECKQCVNETCSSITNPVKQNCNDKEACTPGCICYENFYYRADKDSHCQHRCLCPEMENSPDCAYLQSYKALFTE